MGPKIEIQEANIGQRDCIVSDTGIAVMEIPHAVDKIEQMVKEGKATFQGENANSDLSKAVFFYQIGEERLAAVIDLTMSNRLDPIIICSEAQMVSLGMRGRRPTWGPYSES